MIITAPNPILFTERKPTIFLCGSIENGAAEDWQTKFADYLDRNGYNVLNPRRKDWTKSWECRASNINFRDQVVWEQNALAVADRFLIWLDDATQSPISLLEFGQICCTRKPAIVFASPKFWKYGNIEIMCHLYGIPLINNEIGIEEIINQYSYLYEMLWK